MENQVLRGCSQNKLDAGLSLHSLVPQDSSEVMKLYKTYRLTTYSQSRLEGIFESFPSLALWFEKKIIAFCYTEQFAPDVIEISNVFVEKSWRSKGVGSYLLGEMHKACFSCGYGGAIVSNSMLFETQEAKMSAKTFYLRMGYRCVLSTDNTNVYALSFKGVS